MLRRALYPTLLVYLLLALLGHVQERRGRLTCNCRSDCWCKRRGLSLFRWVFPVAHSLQ